MELWAGDVCCCVHTSCFYDRTKDESKGLVEPAGVTFISYHCDNTNMKKPWPLEAPKIGLFLFYPIMQQPDACCSQRQTSVLRLGTAW